jgi:TRAP-type C4-dicarboxylate transport system permease small subunit
VIAVLIRVLEWIVVALMGVITTILIAEVTLRGLADHSLIITDELARYLMVWTAMLAASLLVYENGHVRITLLLDAVSPRKAAVLYMISELVVLCFLAVLILSSLLLIPSVRGQHTVTLGVSMVWFHAALPIGGALMFVLTVRALILRLKAFNETQ